MGLDRDRYNSSLYSATERHVCNFIQGDRLEAFMEQCHRAFSEAKSFECFFTRGRYQLIGILAQQHSQEWANQDAGSPGLRHLRVCGTAYGIHRRDTGIDLFIF